MKKFRGDEPKEEWYNELCGKKYVDVEFQLANQNGELSSFTKKLSDFVEDGTKRSWGVIFFTTWCPWSPPSIDDMKKYAKGKDVMLIALCVDEDQKKMSEFLGRHTKFLFDGFKVVGYCPKDFKNYRVLHSPHIVMINKERKVIRNYVVEVCEDNPDSYDIDKIFKESLL